MSQLSALIDYERLPLQGSTTKLFHLECFREFLGALGSPHRALRIVHVAGTRGKGTAATLLAEALAHRGHRVGLYRSPHVDDLRERITVDGAWIGREAFARHAATALSALGHAGRDSSGAYRTFFECLTAIAFLHFAQRRVDWAVVETGLGGRLDATNVVDPALTVITAIGIDHTRVLGTDLASIAREKAGIIKAGVPCVLAPQPRGHARLVSEVIGERAREVGARVRHVSRLWDWEIARHSLAGLEIRLGRQGDPLDRPLRLSHPGFTGAPALATVAEALSALGEKPIARSGERFTWPLPGRFEVLRGRPLAILDGAHCPLAAQELGRTLRALTTGPLRVCLAMMSDKDHAGFVRALQLRPGDLVALPRRDLSRAAEPEQLAETVHRLAPGVEALCFPTLSKALRHLRETRPAGPTVVTGSFYHLAPARRALARIG